MVRTLLATTCTQQPDGSFIPQHTYYDPARRANPTLSAINSEYGPQGFTCSAYQIAPDVKLDEYCAVDTSGNGFLRTVYSNGGNGVVQFYRFVDSQSSLCDGACDLAIIYELAANTSAPTIVDGKLIIEAVSSHLPISCYVPTLGNPTVINANPQIYQFLYNNVPAGTYVAELQDANNCQLSTNPLTVGFGSQVVGPAPTWFKYCFKESNSGYSLPQLTGYAWDASARHGYDVVGININLPVFNERLEYPKGQRVFWYFADSRGDFFPPWRIFEAQRDLHLRPNTTPWPTRDSIRDGDWALVNDGFHATSQGLKDLTGIEDYTINFFNPRLLQVSYSNGNPKTYGYPQDMIVRYGYDKFYRSKVNLTTSLSSGQSWSGTTPAPTPLVSDANWEYLPGYTDYCFLAPESLVVDSYQYGTAVRRVSYYGRNPVSPNVVPIATVAVPATDPGDYVLLNDTTPDVETRLGDLQLIDLIKNDVDDAGAENGSVWLVAQTPSPPLRFHLVNGVRAGYQQDNATGIYENLHPGQFQVYIKDAADRQLVVDFTIEEQYRPRWELTFDDLTRTPAEAGSTLTARVYQRGWAGGVTQVTGGADPVTLSWDSGTDPAGTLPQSLGAELQFNLRTQVAQQFLDTASRDDRFHRVDLYRGQQLLFRGYVDATSYREPLLGPGQPVTIAATCGLGKLRDTNFIDYYNERQTARTNMLSIVLKALSFCDVNLPVHCALNLREQLMAADADPLQAAWVHRDAYDKKDGKYIAPEDFIDCRTVLDNILALFNAQLFQADGAWRIISLNEVHDLTTAVRVWSPAGTLRTGVATAVPPLRVLPPEDATGDREMYWIKGGQVRTTYAEARIAKAVVDLKLEASLFDNGNFALWNLNRPTYWITQGSVAVSKVKGEKAHEYAARFSGYTTVLDQSSYLLSPAAPHLPGQQEDYMRLKLRAIVDSATTNPAPSTLKFYVQVVCDGTPYGNPIAVPMSSADKWKDYAIDLPLGLPGNRVRVRLLEPVLDINSPASTLRLASAYLSIQPGQLDWSDQKTDYEEAISQGVTTGIRVPDAEIANADLPLLPALNGTPLPAKGMDVYAWRHAVSLADYTPTTAWKRPGYPSYTSLLHNVAQDRLALRYAPVPEYSGEVTGPGVRHLRVGMMLDLPVEGDGKFYLTDVAVNLRGNSARIACRLLADGTYDGAYPEVPGNVRVAKVLNRFGYRASVVGGVQGFRVAYR